MAGNAQNNSSAVIKLSSGSQAKKSAADFCFARRYTGTPNPGVLLLGKKKKQKNVCLLGVLALKLGLLALAAGSCFPG